jgi:antitoxin component YwqK of YwqJK toxin-antitoxin module
MGQKDGKWRKYDTDGTLLYTIEYQNDQEVKFNGNNISFPDTKPDK